MGKQAMQPTVNSGPDQRPYPILTISMIQARLSEGPWTMRSLSTATIYYPDRLYHTNVTQDIPCLVVVSPICVPSSLTTQRRLCPRACVMRVIQANPRVCPSRLTCTQPMACCCVSVHPTTSPGQISRSIPSNRTTWAGVQARGETAMFVSDIRFPVAQQTV